MTHVTGPIREYNLPALGVSGPIGEREKIQEGDKIGEFALFESRPIDAASPHRIVHGERVVPHGSRDRLGGAA
jgi:hypothetical protein